MRIKSILQIVRKRQDFILALSIGVIVILNAQGTIICDRYLIILTKIALLIIISGTTVNCFHPERIRFTNDNWWRIDWKKEFSTTKSIMTFILLVSSILLMVLFPNLKFGKLEAQWTGLLVQTIFWLSLIIWLEDRYGQKKEREH